LASLRGLQVASANAKEVDIYSNSLRSIGYAREGNPLTSREHGWDAVWPGSQTLLRFLHGDRAYCSATIVQRRFVSSPASNFDFFSVS
jgi:hypothetical protein